MAITSALIGSEYYMGNASNPEQCKVSHLVGFADLTESDQLAYALLGKQHGYNHRTCTYVCFWSKRKHDAEASFRTLPSDVFCGCAHESFDAMLEAYLDNAPTFSGLLRCTLPGER